VLSFSKGVVKIFYNNKKRERKVMKKISVHFIAAGIAVSFALQAPVSYAGSVTAASKATATLSSMCVISSQNVNFGQISLPISAQSSTSSISVQCTKGSTYTIGLAYGGIYGSGTSTSGNYYQTIGTTGGCGGGAAWYQYNSSGSQVGSVYCTANTSTPPTGYNVDQGGKYYQVATYAYGKMVGSVSGDSIGYAIQVPGKPSQVWNTGNYTYSSTGTGATQSIPVVATLVPAQTTNQYPTVDTYLDTVTATLSY
jgi:spore coat protein U-like protein